MSHDLSLLEALREVDALTPAAPALAPPSTPLSPAPFVLNERITFVTARLTYLKYIAKACGDVSVYWGPGTHDPSEPLVLEEENIFWARGDATPEVIGAMRAAQALLS